MDKSPGHFLDALKTWAAERPDILAVAVVGSHARGMARPDSDIDIIAIVDDPAQYLNESAWLERLGDIRSISDGDWGLVQSRRVQYADGTEAEFGITVRSWAGTDPVDPGTKDVVSDGMRILYDRETLLQAPARTSAANALFLLTLACFTTGKFCIMEGAKSQRARHCVPWYVWPSPVGKGLQDYCLHAR